MAGAVEDSASSGPGAGAATTAARCFLPIALLVDEQEMMDVEGRESVIRLDSAGIEFVLVCVHKSGLIRRSAHPKQPFYFLKS